MDIMECKICYNSKENLSFEVKEMMFGFRDKFTYFQCSNCGCLQILNIPKNIDKYYPSNYYSYELPKSIKNTKPFKFFRNFVRDRYAIFRKGTLGKFIFTIAPKESFPMLMKLELKVSSSILDVGCGSGSLLFRLSEMGFTHLQGVDPFINEEITLSTGVKIIKDTVHNIKGSWDVIMFNHSFEHIPNPKETLQSVFELLSREGICIIRIPTVSSYAWEKYKENWVQLDAPRHFFIHSKESIKHLANEVGLKVIDIEYDSTAFQFYGSEQYLKDIPLNDPRAFRGDLKNSIFSKKDIKLFTNMAIELNEKKEGDSCAFFLQKK